jgi:hypothetical protein
VNFNFKVNSELEGSTLLLFKLLVLVNLKKELELEVVSATGSEEPVQA